MNTFTVTTMINRPIKEVFDFMTDPANSTKWQSGTVSAKLVSEGPIGAGSIVRTVGKMMGREFASDNEITQWDPPSVWGIKSSSGPIKFEGTNKFESKDGGTLVTQSFQGEVGGFFKLAEGMAVKQIQKQVEADGQRLKKLLESK
jgi:carbon monoxide dehydrogenase subunit G